MEKPGFGAGRVEWATFRATAGRATNDYRYRHTRAPVHLGRHVDDLVKAAGDEIDKLHLGDGTHSHQRRAHSRTNDGGLGHRRIDHALRPKLFQEARADLERTAIAAYV